MKIIDAADESSDGSRRFNTVELSEGIYADVMLIFNIEVNKDIPGYACVMQCADRGTVYTMQSDGNSVVETVNHGYTEDDIVQFVLVMFEEADKVDGRQNGQK